MFGRATITLGIGPHSSCFFYFIWLSLLMSKIVLFKLLEQSVYVCVVSLLSVCIIYLSVTLCIFASEVECDLCVCVCAVFLCVWSVLEMSGQRTRRSLRPSEWRPTRSARHSVQSCHWQPTNRWWNSKAADTRLLPGFESSIRVSYCCTSHPVTQWKLEFLMPKVTNWAGLTGASEIWLIHSVIF